MIRTSYLNKLLSLGLVLLIWGLGYFGGWWDFIVSPKNITDQPQSSAKPRMMIHKNTISGWDNHQKAWQIKAENIWQVADGSIIYFETISEGVIFSVAGERLHFTAGWVRWEKPHGRLYFGDGLTVSLRDGTLKTPEAILDYRNQIIRSEKKIQFCGAELSLSAQKMQADINKEELVLEGDVELEQQGDRIQAQGLFYDLKEKRYELQNPKEMTIHL
ncbi:LPS export ABC transporter protein LptC [Hydrogenispora ethanolica]|uniref:LPS export ABC transporter protein LptC n=1 Tax=Hydrogenispora ethanolica TaxID=1082276 RepID=A0A4R1R946_HYDET|nr:LPS export ABC transporter periplasmic protein LptC [Hydrogenispora ethanolica]TCL62215.1 LPS export ABC transporter protein LptC [Hydrogenispora ethanolica]